VNLYAETSAGVAWLLGEAGGEAVAARLAAADEVIASDLTLIECDRVLIRAGTMGEMTQAQLAEVRHHLARATARWFIQPFAPEVVLRARRPFPAEPLRTLDALHLSFALKTRGALPDLEVLTLDHRVRENASAMGLVVTPDL